MLKKGNTHFVNGQSKYKVIDKKRVMMQITVKGSGTKNLETGIFTPKTWVRKASHLIE